MGYDAQLDVSWYIFFTAETFRGFGEAFSVGLAFHRGMFEGELSEVSVRIRIQSHKHVVRFIVRHVLRYACEVFTMSLRST